MPVAPIPVVTDFSYTELKERVEVLSRRVNSLTAMEVSLIDIDQTPSINITEDNSLLKLPDLSQIDCEQLAEDLIACDAALVTCEETVTGLEEDIVDLENSLTASFGCTSFGYGIYQYNMMNGNVCISTYTNSLGQKRLKMDWSAVGNQVTISPGSGGGQSGNVKLYCDVWSDTAKIGQVSWGNSDNIIMPYRFYTPLKGPVKLSGSYTSNNYPISGSATHIRLTPQTDSTYIAGIIRISDIPEFP